MKNYLKGFFSNDGRTGCDITVTLVMTDAAGTVTTTAADSKKNVYTVKLSKLIVDTSFTSFSIAPWGVISSTIDIKGPYETGLATSIKSSAPLSGSFTVTCPDLQGVQWKTGAMKWNVSPSDFE